MINSSLVNNSYRRVRKESDELLCAVWSLVTVRNQLPARVVDAVVTRWLDYLLEIFHT